MRKLMLAISIERLLLQSPPGGTPPPPPPQNLPRLSRQPAQFGEAQPTNGS
jgi:hypothetical protein